MKMTKKNLSGLLLVAVAASYPMKMLAESIGWPLVMLIIGGVSALFALAYFTYFTIASLADD